MKLVIFTKSTFFVEEDKILTALFEAGMDNLHLYKPGSSPMYSERLLSLLSDDYYKKITVHDHYYLKNEYGLGGINIDNPESPLPEGYKGHFSRTCTRIDQLKEAKRKARYVFLDYVFDGITLPQQKAAHTPEQLKEAAKRGWIDKHVYALGGVTLDNIKAAKDMGFGGVAVRGDLWNRFDIHNQVDYKELIAHFAKLRKAAG